MNRKVIIGLPIYNEQEALPHLFRKLETLRDVLGDALHCLLVDDGSTDRSRDLLAKFTASFPHAVLLAHPENRGLGEAMRTMIGYAAEQFGAEDILVTLDADNTHDPAMIPAMVEKLREEGLDLVVASRFARGGAEHGVPLVRKLYSRGAAALLRPFFHVPGVTDYSSGFRAYRVGLLQKASRRYQGRLITSRGFSCMAEMMAKFSKIGVKAGEYPLVLEYGRKEGPSKMKAIRTIAEYIRLLVTVKRPPIRSEQEPPAIGGLRAAAVSGDEEP